MQLIRLFWILILLAACSSALKQRQNDIQQWMQPSGKVKVLATTEMIADSVKRVGGDRVDTLTLIVGELDPHSYQLVKGDGELFDRADLVVYNGIGLEHTPSIVEKIASAKESLSLGGEIQRSDPALILVYGGATDPHIWMDISLWNRAVPFIVEKLSAIDPSHAIFYKSNGEKLILELKEAHERVYALLQSIPSEKRYLISSHDAFNYFARAYMADPGELLNGEWQERFAAPEGLSPESQLSTADIQLIIDHLKKYRIKVLFPETNVSKASIRKILSAGEDDELKLIIAPEELYADAMGPSGSDGDTYVKMVEHNAQVIAKYLKQNGAVE